jgi:hypothetical protein
MKKNKIIRFVESFVLLPIVTTIAVPGGNLPNSNPVVSAPQVVLSQKLNSVTGGLLAFNQAEAPDPVVAMNQLRAEAIDAYFSERGMPLAGTGLKMVEAATDNDLDWRLVAAIAVRESTGGKNDCNKVNNNPFGWGSCKIGFKSIDDAINTIATNLGGNNPKTAHHYDNKTTIQILRAYNPPSVVPRYAQQVMSIMDAIGTPNLGDVSNNDNA